MRSAKPCDPYLWLAVLLVIGTLATASYISAQMRSGVATAKISIGNQGDGKTRDPDEIFSDGFETGDTSRWAIPDPACDASFEIPVGLVEE